MNKNIVWTIEGKIDPNKKHEYFALMDEMIAEVSNESGALAYEWTMGLDGETVHVYERYLNEEQTKKHLGTWARFAPRYLALVQVNKFIVYSELPHHLKDAVATLNPTYMKPIGGFSKFLNFL